MENGDLLRVSVSGDTGGARTGERRVLPEPIHPFASCCPAVGLDATGRDCMTRGLGAASVERSRRPTVQIVPVRAICVAQALGALGCWIAQLAGVGMSFCCGLPPHASQPQPALNPPGLRSKRGHDNGDRPTQNTAWIEPSAPDSPDAHVKCRHAHGPATEGNRDVGYLATSPTRRMDRPETMKPAPRSAAGISLQSGYAGSGMGEARLCFGGYEYAEFGT